MGASSWRFRDRSKSSRTWGAPTKAALAEQQGPAFEGRALLEILAATGACAGGYGAP